MLLDPSHPAPIWVIWPNLSSLERLSFLTLCILSVYSLFLAATVMRLLNTTSDQENRERISKRVRNLRQATIALLAHWCNDNELRFALNTWVMVEVFRADWDLPFRSMSEIAC